MHAILSTQADPALTPPSLAARVYSHFSQTLPWTWTVSALPLPEVSESTWADWVAEEARFLAS
ncbi:hypothetical protein [Roseateles sp.]|jgi:hypothetical protein|uniref:hypothetical protein n=1 Tax=Roseateles sp. TaxID=1971397 RepID=UPI0037C6848C